MLILRHCHMEYSMHWKEGKQFNVQPEIRVNLSKISEQQNVFSNMIYKSKITYIETLYVNDSNGVNNSISAMQLPKHYEQKVTSLRPQKNVI